MNSSIKATLLLGLATVTCASAATAGAHVRISTGRDLYAACQVLAEYTINPQGPTPRPALYCRQYIAGYFSSARYVRENGDTKKALDLPPAADECASVAGPQTFDQLAAKIVHQADWRPALLDKPAIELARAAFGSKPPC